jgi:hypothetical protein
VRVIRQAGPGEPFNLIYAVTRIQPLFTPAFALLCVVGIAVLFVRRNKPVALVVVVAVVAVAKLATYGVPKWIITAVPALCIAAVAGASALWSRKRLRVPLFAVALLPWCMGVRITYAGVLWGPGFELRSFESPPVQTTRPWVVLGAGTAVPTPEGPRPLMGHAWVLGGAWRRFVQDNWREQLDAVEEATHRGVPTLILDYGPGWSLDAYLELGFHTEDPASRMILDGVSARRLRRNDGNTSLMIAFLPASSEFGPAVAHEIQQQAGSEVVCLAFSSTLARLTQLRSGALKPMGKTTAIISLERLASGT